MFFDICEFVLNNFIGPALGILLLAVIAIIGIALFLLVIAAKIAICVGIILVCFKGCKWLWNVSLS